MTETAHCFRPNTHDPHDWQVDPWNPADGGVITFHCPGVEPVPTDPTVLAPMLVEAVKDALDTMYHEDVTGARISWPGELERLTGWTEPEEG